MRHQAAIHDGLVVSEHGLALGRGSGDRFGAFRGGSGSFKESVLQAEKPAELQGKRVAKRVAKVT